MFIEVKGGKLFAIRGGPQSGTAIVAIGGWIGSSELWLEPLASLSDAYVTVSYDHRGAGLSTCAAASITFDALVHDALVVLDAFGIHRCVLAAESAGAQTALAVAARYPWVRRYTPVNEPLTTARFSALYGVWYPHASDDRSFVQAVILQCRATVLAMQAIRQVNPAAMLMQTDDLGKTYSTPQRSELEDFYNERRWLAWDLLCGRVGPSHTLWDYLAGTGINTSELLWFHDHPSMNAQYDEWCLQSLAGLHRT